MNKEQKSKFDEKFVKKVKRDGVSDEERAQDLGGGKFRVFDDRNANRPEIPMKKIKVTGMDRLKALLSGDPDPREEKAPPGFGRLVDGQGTRSEIDYDQTFTDGDVEIKVSKPGIAKYEPRGEKVVDLLGDDRYDTEDDKEAKRAALKSLAGKKK